MFTLYFKYHMPAEFGFTCYCDLVVRFDNKRILTVQFCQFNGNWFKLCVRKIVEDWQGCGVDVYRLMFE